MHLPDNEASPSAATVTAPPFASCLSESEPHDILAEFVHRMCDGDEGALAALYDATGGRIYSTALRFVRDIHVAEEVVSDVYLQAWTEARSYDPRRGRVMAWLLVCCRSRALDTLRRNGPTKQEIAPDEDAEMVDAETACDLLEATRRCTAVQQALQGMSPIQRQLLSLSFFRGCSHSEIARREGMPLGSVKSQIRGALACLRTVLSGYR